MAPWQRSIGRIGGVIALVVSCFGVGAAIWRPTAEATGIATMRWASQMVHDSIRAHRTDDRAWRDSVSNQLLAIRCNSDTAYRTRHADECAWRVSQ